MAHLLRAKQSGVTSDFSANILPDLFRLDDLQRYGIASQISALAYDPVQSLLAVGTRATQYGDGQIYVFGGGRTSVVFNLRSSRGATVKELQFCSDRLLCLDTKNDLNIFSLAEKKCVASYSPPGAVTAITSDPTLDYVILGMQHGTFILTGHEDTSLVFWDPRDGRALLARTFSDTRVDEPLSAASATAFKTGAHVPKHPIIRIAWCANGADPDDTALLIAGGTPAHSPSPGLALLELGRSPLYATSTWQLLTEHFEQVKRLRILPTPPNVQVADFCLVPRKTPWFAGAHDPIAVIAVLASGEITTLSFPSGFPISPTNQLHVSLTMVHPFVTSLAHASVGRGRWLGLVESRPSGPPIIKGGFEATKPLKRFEDRSILQTGHADGTVRMWDVGHADEIENPSVLQADVGRAVGRMENVAITQTSFSGVSGELAAGLKTGEVIVFKWSRNARPGQEPPPPEPNAVRELTKVSDRKDPSLVEGFQPLTLLNQQDGPCTALKVGDVGFIAAGFEGGSIAMIDMRGPALILNANISEHISREKHGPFRKRSNSTLTPGTHVTTLAFSVMTIEHDAYSSILLHAGTSHGHLLTFKILPGASGRYTVEFAGSTTLDGAARVLLLHPLNATTGKSAFATQNAVGSLRDGRKTDGVLLAVTTSGARIFKPAVGKGASRSWDGGAPCDSAAVTHCQDLGIALVCVFGDATTRSYTIPGLREINAGRLDGAVAGAVDTKRLREALITPSGDIIAWKGPSELSLLNVWGSGAAATEGLAIGGGDRIFNPDLLIPPRPTISNFQWVSGTQYITPSDMDVLISGPDRPPSKRMLAQATAAQQQRRAETRGAGAGRARAAAGTASDQSPEGYWAYMQRQVQERTEKLGLMGDNMERLEENSSSWSDEVGKYVAKQKRNVAVGLVKRQFGL